jgi:8-oxo-dGTP pyrophosphatase MutT (NUDIX family)
MGEDSGWKILSSETHFSNRNLRVVTENICSPARTEARSWTIVQRKSAVIIAAMTHDKELILIRQERIPVRAAIWEVPGGQIDEADADETQIRAAALRELKEETGYELAKDGEIIALGHYFSSPGFTDECGCFFLVRPVEPSADGCAHGESEAIVDCRAFSVSEVGRMIAENEIRDANTLGICARLVARGFISFA